MATEIRFSRRKSVAYASIILFGFFLMIEIGARLVAFAVYSFSPYYLVYGFVDAYIDDTEEGHTATLDGYFKFPPSRVLHQYGLFRQPTPIHINNLGFRGPDFKPEKSEGIIRIVCMGGSSTFGFYNRDDHTYPAYLRQKLGADYRQPRFEILNAGIPHMNTDHIVAMLQGEILRYEPDVVTLYSAFNDAGAIKDETRLQAFARWIHYHFASYVALKRLVSALGGPTLYSRWSTYLPQADANHIDSQIELHVLAYERNLRAFIEMVRASGATPILIRQAMTTKFGGNADWRPDPNLDYAGEVRWLRERLEQDGWIPGEAVTMLVHAALIETLDRIAREQGVEVVDNIAFMGGRQELFASYVHLSEAANEVLADELARRVLRIAGVADGNGSQRGAVRPAEHAVGY